MGSRKPTGVSLPRRRSLAVSMDRVRRFSPTCAGVLLVWSAGAIAEPVVYVDRSATGANNGSSWHDAYVSLQTALAFARAPGSGVTEIRVAQGTYTPAPGGGDRALSFALVEGVLLKGGYAGVTSPDPGARNPGAYPTILDGDLRRNDDQPCEEDTDCAANPLPFECVLSFCTGDNAYHVVSAGTEITPAATIDGFSISAGSAFGPGIGAQGGGMRIDGGDPVVRGCIFHHNTAQTGGGVYNTGGMPRFVNTLFYANTAVTDGAAIFTTNATATILNSTITQNTSANFSGGITSANTSTVITNTILWDNAPIQFRVASGGTLVVDHTCIQDLPPGLNNNGNIGDDPNFSDPGGADFRLQSGSACQNSGNNAPTGGLPATDLDGSVRVVGPAVDMGAYERAGDCNQNGVADNFDLIDGTSTDCGDDGRPDECQISTTSTAPGGPFFCAANCAVDCNNNAVPDTCEPDCNNNDVADACDIRDGISLDCNRDGVPDECSPDCNENGVRDVCDVFNRTSPDCNDNNVPDECEITDDGSGLFFCEQNCDPDCDGNHVPDECQVDCNDNGVPDVCDITINGTSQDCILNGQAFGNGVPDECEIDADSTAPGGPYFCTSNCSPDCNNDGVPDRCQPDCNFNNTPDDCDISQERSEDCDENNVPDECQEDADGDGVINPCDLCPGTNPGVPVRDDGCEQFGACCTSTGFCLTQPQFAGACLALPGAKFLGDGSTCTGDPDGDQVIGCNDLCQFDPGKTAPGICGCGVPDDGAAIDDPDCHGPSADPIGDVCRINAGTSPDCNANRVPDECEIDENSEAPGIFYCTFDCLDDCNNNGVPDVCEIDESSPGPGAPYFCTENCLPDCQPNGVLDVCDLNDGTSDDCDDNGVPDECQPDTDGDGNPDACDPCNGDDILIGGFCDHPGDPDPCETGVLDCASGVLICTDGPEPDDADGDGIFDCHDRCPGTPPETDVDAAGCPFQGACCFPGGCFDGLSPDDCVLGVGGQYQGNGTICPCPILGDGDCNDDGDTDIDDYALIIDCIHTLDGGPVTPPCLCADMNGDGFVNLIDLPSLQANIEECVEDCPFCPRDFGVVLGDCCDVDGLGSPGCDQVPAGGQAYTCCEAVCTQMPSCCTVQWTEACALSAIRDFPSECACPPVAEACCFENNGLGICEQLTASDCVISGGVPLSRDDRFTDCDTDGQVCEGVCPTGVPFSDACCSPTQGRDTPGCFSFSNCCNDVCQQKPSCCFDKWGPECVSIAETITACNCPKVACCGEQGAQCTLQTPELCRQDDGFPQDSGTTCSDTNGNFVPDACEIECPTSSTDCCSEFSIDPGCADTACCEAVCSESRSCCEGAWDASCLAIAATLEECDCPVQACCVSEEVAPGLRCVDVAAVIALQQCNALGGSLGGVATRCVDDNGNQVADVCEVSCPVGATGDCCSPFGLFAPGCGDEDCCTAVCEIDVSCCRSTGNWDPQCSVIAAGLTVCNCPEVGCCFPTNNPPLSCSNVAAVVCDGIEAPVICAGEDLNGNNIDDTCDVCGPTAGDCCDPLDNLTPGCNYVPCCEALCLQFPFCCEDSWSLFNCMQFMPGVPECDGVCDVCGPVSGDCCDPKGNLTPGCNNVPCCEAVCTQFPECCQDGWSSSGCAELSASVPECAGVCP